MTDQTYLPCTQSITEEEEVGPVPVPLPVQLEDNADAVIRELAYAAQKYGRMAAVDPSNSDAIYNHGLALQELALRASTSRTDQEKLLQQVLMLIKTPIRSHPGLYWLSHPIWTLCPTLDLVTLAPGMFIV